VCLLADSALTISGGRTGLTPFVELAMSSPSTAPTVSSANPPSPIFSPTVSPSQTGDGNGGPSSSLYLYGTQSHHNRTVITIAHSFFLSSSCTRGLWRFCSPLRPAMTIMQVHLPRDVILIAIRLVRDYTPIFHPSSSVQEAHRRGYPRRRHTASSN